jgi:hypothetical protein
MGIFFEMFLLIFFGGCIDRLEDDELEDDHFDEQTETSKTEAHIYEDLCYVKIPSRRVRF